MSNDTAAYVVDWLKGLRDNQRLRRNAAAQARHAANYILRAPAHGDLRGFLANSAESL